MSLVSCSIQTMIYADTPKLRMHQKLTVGNGIHNDVRVSTINKRQRKEKMRVALAKALYIPYPRLRLNKTDFIQIIGEVVHSRRLS